MAIHNNLFFYFSQFASQVVQSVAVCSLSDQAPLLLQMLSQHMAEDPEYKIMVFFTTARLTQYFAELFNAAGINVLEVIEQKQKHDKNC